MKLLIDLPSNQFSRIQKLLDTGSYASVDLFITTAVENQFHLENDPSAPTIDHPMAKMGNSKKTNQDNIEDENFNLLAPPNGESEKTVEPPSWNQLISGSEQNTVEGDAWLLGLCNRIFPVKVALRILANLLNSGNSILLDDYLSKATTIARKYGYWLSQYEDKKRGEKLSAAFPIGNEKSKSENRFRSIFLISVRSESGNFDGMLAKLKFANIKKENNLLRPYLTKAGLEFSKLKNPVIDSKDFTSSLSQEEKEFYLSHCKTNVPGEFNALTWFLKKIRDGVNNSDLINRAIQTDWVKTKKNSWSVAMINTQRAGVTSRLFELGLINKIPRGREVTYYLTKFGDAFLTKSN